MDKRYDLGYISERFRYRQQLVCPHMRTIHIHLANVDPWCASLPISPTNYAWMISQGLQCTDDKCTWAVYPHVHFPQAKNMEETVLRGEAISHKSLEN